MLEWNWVWEIWVRFKSETERVSKKRISYLQLNFTEHHPGLTGFIKLLAGTETGLQIALEIPNSMYTCWLSFSVQQLSINYSTTKRRSVNYRSLSALKNHSQMQVFFEVAEIETK